MLEQHIQHHTRVFVLAIMKPIHQIPNSAQLHGDRVSSLFRKVVNDAINKEHEFLVSLSSPAMF